MSVSTILSTIAPQYDSLVSRSEFISLAETQVNRCWFRNKADLAVALMTAHMISVFTSSYRQDGTGGSVTSKREGDLALSFAQSVNGNSDLNQTSYGKQFQSLMKSGGFFIGCTGGGILNNVC
ncbi:MAG: DUF4054 domain-containing protein [Nitrosopumilaceae archaeon]|jgi:hypothetical protein